MMKFVFLVALLVLSSHTVQGHPEPLIVPFALAVGRNPIGRCPPRDIPNKPPRILPDANNCRFYYECSGGEMIPRECPEGMCFSRRTKGCL